MKKSLIILILSVLVLSACNSPESFNGKFEDALKLKSEFSCTGGDDKGNTLNVLIKNTKFKATANTRQGAINSVGDSIDCIYGWIEGSQIGEEVCLTKEEKENNVNILEKSKDTGIMVNCTKSSLNDSIFEIPKNIEFLPPG